MNALSTLTGPIQRLISWVRSGAAGRNSSESRQQVEEALADATIEHLLGSMHNCSQCSYWQHAQRDPERALNTCPTCGLRLIKKEE
jgi:DNA-directed RNA polymerase subunit RPC12/RpoP